MVQAVWKDTVIAESDQTVQVEGNHYFPPDAVKQEYLSPSPSITHCPWKGQATYFSVVVDGDENVDAAFTYAEPKSAAQEIKGHFAFWNGVEIS